MKEKRILRHILVPVDDSPLSRNAQELAVFIAKRFNSKITALHVVTHELMHPLLERFHPETHEYVTSGPRDQVVPWVHVSEPSVSPVIMEVTNVYRQKGEDVVSDAVMLFKEEGISADRKLVEHADPAEAILREAQKGRYDLIVMARSAGEEEMRSHLGSVAAKVSIHAQMPVLIAAEGRQISKILVPVDGSNASEKAARFGSLLAKKIQAAMSLLYVQELGLFRLKPELTKKIGMDILSSLAKHAEGIKVDQRLDSGDPARVINRTAGREGYDLIVIGVKPHSAARRFLLGSVSDHVIHYTNHAVLLVK